MNAKAKVRSPRQKINQIRIETYSESNVTRLPPVRNFVRSEIEVRRFNQNAAVTNQGFSLQNGHDQFLVVTSALGAAVPYVDSWRIKKIDIWATAAMDGTATSVTLSPVGTDSSNMNNDPEQLFEVVGRSPTEPTHLCVVPSKVRPFGSWHFTSTTGFASTLFQINITNNTGANNTRVVMDITFETRKNLAGLPLGYGATTATTTLGTLGGRNILSGMALIGVNNLG